MADRTGLGGPSSLGDCMASESANDTYGDLGYWDQITGNFVARIKRLRVPASYDAVLDAVCAMLTEIGQDFQQPEQPSFTPSGRRMGTLEMSGHAGMYVRGGEEHKQRGLIAQLRDTGDGKCVISIACYWPLNYADETRRLLAGLKLYWPDITPLADQAEADVSSGTHDASERVLARRRGVAGAPTKTAHDNAWARIEADENRTGVYKTWLEEYTEEIGGADALATRQSRPIEIFDSAMSERRRKSKGLK